MSFFTLIVKFTLLFSRAYINKGIVILYDLGIKCSFYTSIFYPLFDWWRDFKNNWLLGTYIFKRQKNVHFLGAWSQSALYIYLILQPKSKNGIIPNF